MFILGIHGGVTVHQHDAAACLFKNGKLICFIEEERLCRIKSSIGMMPTMAVEACLKEANINIKKIDYVIITGNTYKDIRKRTAEWLLHHFGFAPKIVSINHQLAHAASAFYQSNFKESTVITYDSYGDRLSGIIAKASKKKGIQIIRKIPAKNSLGVFYSTMTSFLGFRPNEDEYKVMGLAPYGKNNINLNFFLKPSKYGFYCNKKFYRERADGTVFEKFYSKLLTKKLGKPRIRGEIISDKYKNIACSTQVTLEKTVINFIKYAYKYTKIKNFCFAGGVALNCSMNGKIYKDNFVNKMFIQPAASDRGLALGCALYFLSKKKIKIKKIKHVYYGPTYTKNEIENSLKISGLKYKSTKNPSALAANLIAKGKIIAWYQGRSEFGPRALGNRSILAHPGIKSMKDKINKKVKFREEFRPFAPAVMEDYCHKIFEMREASPFMTTAFQVKEEWIRKIPATTHIDNSARVQTVNKTDNKKFYNLIKKFFKITKIPVVLNTSFNIRGQPIVETPFDALSTFAANGIDDLIIENFHIRK